VFVAQNRICTVSFTDPEGLSHSVDVAATALYEAAVLAVAEFRRAGLYDVHIGPGTRLRVAVKLPEAAHEVQFGKLEEWLTGGARSPKEQVTKARLRRVLAGGKEQNVALCRVFLAREKPVSLLSVTRMTRTMASRLHCAKKGRLRHTAVRRGGIDRGASRALSRQQLRADISRARKTRHNATEPASPELTIRTGVTAMTSVAIALLN
jgi:hypothetical protein